MDTTTPPPPAPPSDAAERLLARLRELAAELDDEERALFAALLAPGVAAAYETDEVIGFDADDVVRWHPAALPESLSAAITGRQVRITGLDA